MVPREACHVTVGGVTAGGGGDGDGEAVTPVAGGGGGEGGDGGGEGDGGGGGGGGGGDGAGDTPPSVGAPLYVATAGPTRYCGPTSLL